MNRILVLLLVIPSFSSFAQVEVIQSDTLLERVGPRDTFHFLEDELDSSLLVSVATIKATGDRGRSSIPGLYYGIRDKAKEMGANSFRFVSFSRDKETQIPVLVLRVYLLSQKAFERNEEFKPLNTVYVFGSERVNRGESSSVC